MFTFSLIRLPPDELEELEDLEEFISSSNLNPLFILGIDLSIFKDYLYTKSRRKFRYIKRFIDYEGHTKYGT